MFVCPEDWKRVQPLESEEESTCPRTSVAVTKTEKMKQLQEEIQPGARVEGEPELLGLDVVWIHLLSKAIPCVP